MNNSLVIIDTNVICEAGKTNYETYDALAVRCAEKCTDFIFKFINSPASRLALDTNWEIVKEYQRNISGSGQPTLADSFMRWLYTYLAKIPMEDLVNIQKQNEDSYGMFPADDRLASFDPPDRKFVALANAHPSHPPIVQGTDCKWWGFKDIFKEYGIEIHFLCEDYIKEAFQRKVGE